MSHRGIIGMETPDGNVRRVFLHSVSYPATIYGDTAAGEILLKHYLEPEKVQALIHDSIGKLGITPEETEFHPEKRAWYEDAPLKQCLEEADADIYVEDVYVFGEGGWIYWKTRHSQLPEPLEPVVKRETENEWRIIEERSGKRGVQKKML